MGYNPNILHLYVGYKPFTNHLLTSWDILVVYRQNGIKTGTPPKKNILRLRGGWILFLPVEVECNLPVKFLGEKNAKLLFVSYSATTLPKKTYIEPENAIKLPL